MIYSKFSHSNLKTFLKYFGNFNQNPPIFNCIFKNNFNFNRKFFKNLENYLNVLLTNYTVILIFKILVSLIIFKLKISIKFC